MSEMTEFSTSHLGPLLIDRGAVSLGRSYDTEELMRAVIGVCAPPGMPTVLVYSWVKLVASCCEALQYGLAEDQIEWEANPHAKYCEPAPVVPSVEDLREDAVAYAKELIEECAEFGVFAPLIVYDGGTGA